MGLDLFGEKDETINVQSTYHSSLDLMIICKAVHGEIT